MNKNPINKGIIAENFKGVGAVTRDMVHARAKELAMISGRPPSDVSQADYEQAKRELTGEPDMDRQDEILESLPESSRADPVPVSAGGEDPEPPGEDDEDDEGRNESAQLVEGGLQEAEHDLMVEAEKAAQDGEKRERRGD
jgi:hypothetical protein